MNSKIIVVTGMTLLIFGCGAKDEQASSEQPPASNAVAATANSGDQPVYDASATPEEAYQLTLRAATKLQAKASEMQHEWSRSAEMLDSAGELAANGDFEAALAMAETARQQYRMAIQQAIQQSDQWQTRAVD